jgi:hypothetical protein
MSDEAPDQLRLASACKVGRILAGLDPGVPRWPLPELLGQPTGTMEQIKLQAVEAALKKHRGVVLFAAAELSISRHTIYDILKRAGRKNPQQPSNVVRLVASLVLVGLVAGCATKPVISKLVVSGQIPPLPPARAVTVQGREARGEAAVIAPQPSAARWFAWENWPGARIAVIEKTTDLVNWVQIGRVTNQMHFAVTFEGLQEFYRVGHPAHETHHWFDPVLEIYKCDLEEQ